MKTSKKDCRVLRSEAGRPAEPSEEGVEVEGLKLVSENGCPGGKVMVFESAPRMNFFEAERDCSAGKM